MDLGTAQDQCSLSMANTYHHRGTYTLVALAFMSLIAIVAFTATSFIGNARQHIGADYLSFAGELVRAQQGGRELRQATEHLLDHPEQEHRQQLLQTIWLLDTRRDSIRRYLTRSHLEPDSYRHIEKELDQLDDLLSRFETLTEEAMDSDSSQRSLASLATDIDNSQAFAYSELYQLVLEASAERQRQMALLNRVIIVLSLVVLLVMAGLLIAIVKIIGQKAAMQRLSLTDDLTGLDNRRALTQQAKQGLALAKRQHHPYSIALIDIDHFKLLNDRYGHPVGDQVLQQVATTLRELVRHMDHLARVGGEEFCLLMPNTDEAGARQLCERLRQGIATMIMPEAADNAQLTVSIGIACCADHCSAEQFERLYSEADQALYIAKREGRNRIEVAS